MRDLSVHRGYDRQIVIYRAFRSLVLQALREASLSREQLGKFAEATDEALFLVGPELSDYLGEVYRKGVRLYYTSGRLRDEWQSPRDDHSEVVRENAGVLNWFSENLEAGRLMFGKVIRLG